MGIEAGKALCPGDMARSDNVIFSATGITKGDLLKELAGKAILPRRKRCRSGGKSRTIRRIQSIHYLDRKDPDVQAHILWGRIVVRAFQALRGWEIFLLTNEDKVSDSEQEKTMADWVTGKVTKVQN